MKKFIIALAILLMATASYAQTYTVERVIDSGTYKIKGVKGTAPFKIPTNL